MILKTELLSGAGNTFHINLQDTTSFLSLPNFNERMKKISIDVCSKNKADGFIFLENVTDTSVKESEKFKWYFFNSDGSEAEMCGNATRCIGLFLKEKIKNTKLEWSLETKAGSVRIKKIENNIFKVFMPALKKFDSKLGFFCDTGVPHLVLESLDKELFNHLDSDLKNKSSKLRFHSDLGIKGANVTYVLSKEEKNQIKAVSFERGVEDFTLACGTGAVAAAYYNLTLHGVVETLVEMPGGTLIINLSNLQQPTMAGPAEFLGSFEYDINF